jgi:hypothetical protein
LPGSGPSLPVRDFFGDVVLVGRRFRQDRAMNFQVTLRGVFALARLIERQLEVRQRR